VTAGAAARHRAHALKGDSYRLSEDLGAVDEPVDHRRGRDLVAEDLKISPQAENGLFEVTIRLARS
jgi:hypothetical protein